MVAHGGPSMGRWLLRADHPVARPADATRELRGSFGERGSWDSKERLADRCVRPRARDGQRSGP